MVEQICLLSKEVVRLRVQLTVHPQPHHNVPAYNLPPQPQRTPITRRRLSYVEGYRKNKEEPPKRRSRSPIREHSYCPKIHREGVRVKPPDMNRSPVRQQDVKKKGPSREYPSRPEKVYIPVNTSYIEIYMALKGILSTDPIGVTHPCGIRGPLLQDGSGVLTFLVGSKSTGATLSGSSYLSKQATYPCVRSGTHISPGQHGTSLYGIQECWSGLIRLTL
ncbi:hypothetical protein Peur_000004 [Populus x canadensis]